MSQKKQFLSAAFSKIESLADVKDTNNEEKILDAQECYTLKSPEGHRSNWTEVLLNYSAIETLHGFKEGLRTIHAKECKNLQTTVGLPHSCEAAYFDASDIRALYTIDQRLFTATHMTEGLKKLSLKQCPELYTLRGMPSTCKELMIDETAVCSLKELPHGIETVTATWCKNLKTTKGLPETCQFLDLSFSGIEQLEDIPANIQEVRVYNCSALKKECLKLNEKLKKEEQ
jgi:hypothetical protein